MGIIDDAASVISARTTHSKRSSKSHRSSRHHRRDRSRSKSRSRSRSRHRSSRSTVGGGIASGISGIAASIFGVGGGDDDDDYGGERERERKASSRSAFDSYAKHNASRSSFFSVFGRPTTPGPGTPSYYRRSPRPGLAARLLKKLKRLLRDLLYYAKRHPLKVVTLVLMPLITGGALTALLARFGIRLPRFVERLLGIVARTLGGQGGGGGGGGPLGLVGEAVRMVSSSGGGGGRTGARVL